MLSLRNLSRSSLYIPSWIHSIRKTSLISLQSFSTGSSVTGSTEPEPVASEDGVKSVHQFDTPSIREQLKKVVIEKRLLDHLDRHRLGYLTTRKTRMNVAKKFYQLEQSGGNLDIPEKRSEHPFPFNKYGDFALKMSTFDYEKLVDFDQNPPQVAIIGRSNVGKSTLVNTLLGFNNSFVQKAMVSPTPGETKDLVFYSIGKVPKTILVPAAKDPLAINNKMIEKFIKFPALVLVDMPGYGFAFMTEEVKKRCESLYFQYLFDSQLLHDPPIKRVILLLDARHGLKKTDIDFLNAITEKFKEYRKNAHNPGYLNKRIEEGLTGPMKEYFQQAMKYEKHIKDQQKLKNKPNSQDKNVEESALTSSKQKKRFDRTKEHEESLSSPSSSTIPITGEEEIEEGNVILPLPSSAMASLEMLNFRTEFPKKLSWKLQIVLTKCDLVERLELARRIQLLKSQLLNHVSSYLYNDLTIVPLSGKDGGGLIHLENELMSLISHPEALSYIRVLKEKEQEQAKRKKEKQLERVEYIQKLKKQGLTPEKIHGLIRKWERERKEHWKDTHASSTKKNDRNNKFTRSSNENKQQRATIENKNTRYRENDEDRDDYGDDEEDESFERKFANEQFQKNRHAAAPQDDRSIMNDSANLDKRRMPRNGNQSNSSQSTTGRKKNRWRDLPDGGESMKKLRDLKVAEKKLKENRKEGKKFKGKHEDFDDSDDENDDDPDGEDKNVSYQFGDSKKKSRLNRRERKARREEYRQQGKQQHDSAPKTQKPSKQQEVDEITMLDPEKDREEVNRALRSMMKQKSSSSSTTTKDNSNSNKGNSKYSSFVDENSNSFAGKNTKNNRNQQNKNNNDNNNNSSSGGGSSRSSKKKLIDLDDFDDDDDDSYLDFDEARGKPTRIASLQNFRRPVRVAEVVKESAPTESGTSSSTAAEVGETSTSGGGGGSRKVFKFNFKRPSKSN